MASPLTLRPRQNALLERLMTDIEQHSSVILIAPTGSGKTVMLSAFMARLVELDPDCKILCLVHRKEIFDQNLKTAESFGLKCQVYWGRNRTLERDCNVIFSMQLTCFKALEEDQKVFGKVNYIIVDEAHHINAYSYKFILNNLKLINYYIKSVGWTATPLRGDKEHISDIFKHLSDQIFLGELIETGYLAPFKIIIYENKTDQEEDGEEYFFNDGDDFDDFKDINDEYINERKALFLSPKKLFRWWKEQAFLGSDESGDHYRPTVAFMPSIEICTDMTLYFIENGIKAALVTGTMPQETRQETLSNYACGKIQILFNFGILTEGWNEPYTSCILIGRKRSHSTVVIQMIGRGLRMLTGAEIKHHNPFAAAKKDCLILDYFGCTEGLPGLEQFLTYSTGDDEKKNHEERLGKINKKKASSRFDLMTYEEKLAYFFHKSKLHFDSINIFGTALKALYISVTDYSALIIYLENACLHNSLESIVLLSSNNIPFKIVHKGRFEVSLDIASNFMRTMVKLPYLKRQSEWAIERSNAKSVEHINNKIIRLPIKKFDHAWISAVQRMKPYINKNSVLFYVAMSKNGINLTLDDIFKEILL